MKFENISPSEWRFVLFFSGIAVAITLLPYAWGLAASDEVYQFMGILFNPKDGATYISKIAQGADGGWFFELRHTPQTHDPAAINLFYMFLGQVGSLLSLSNVVVFHLARVTTSFFMFISFYELGSSIWQRQRPRRLFFLMLSFGTGLGWLGLLFYQDVLAPDLTVPEAFPLLAAYTNPHFPLSIGIMTLMTAQIMTIFRPGYDETPNVSNGGLFMIIACVALAIVSPPALIVMGIPMGAYTAVRALTTRQLPKHELRWMVVGVLPALPFALYYFLLFSENDMFSRFNAQNVAGSPPILLTVLGFGLLLFIGLPGIWRALRRFEQDGDQVMLLWLIVNFVVIYIPFFALSRRLLVGLIIPVVYFAVRSLEDFWFQKINKAWHMPALLGMALLMIPSHVITFGAPLAFAVFDREAGAETSLLVNTDYIDAFGWLAANANRDEVVLSAPGIGQWLPAETGQRPVYGHEFETVPADLRLNQVRAFYRGEDCETLLATDSLPFTVSYVLWVPREDAVGVFDSETDDIEDIFGERFVEELNLEELNLEDLNPEDLNLADLADVEELDIRLPTADDCRDILNEQATSTEQFGDVELYILSN